MRAGPTREMTPQEWMASEGPIGDGWDPGEFSVIVNRQDPDSARAPCIGWKKKSFGVYEANANTTLGELRLSTIVHLTTGVPFGIFDQPESAAKACDIMEGMAEWAKFTLGAAMFKKWRGIFEAIDGTWREYGFMVAPASTMAKQTIWMAKPTPTATLPIISFDWRIDPLAIREDGQKQADMPEGRLHVHRHRRPPDRLKPWQGTFATRHVGFWESSQAARAGLEKWYAENRGNFTQALTSLGPRRLQ